MHSSRTMMRAKSSDLAGLPENRHRKAKNLKGPFPEGPGRSEGDDGG